MQQLRDEPVRSQSEKGAKIQKPDPVRPPFCRHGPHGELGLHATIADIQASKFGMRCGAAEKFNHPNFPSAAPSLFG